jgi:hypothetical protein
MSTCALKHGLIEGVAEGNGTGTHCIRFAEAVDALLSLAVILVANGCEVEQRIAEKWVAERLTTRSERFEQLAREVAAT